MNKKLPTTIYVMWNEGGGEPFMEATEDWDTLGERGEKRLVGTYQLVESSHVITETKMVPAKRR